MSSILFLYLAIHTQIRINSKFERLNQLHNRCKFAIKLIASNILLSGTLLSQSAHAKEPFEGYTTSPQTATPSSYTGANDGRSYTFGNGNDLNLESITANGGIIYTPKELADEIFIRRVDNTQVSGERCNIFVERTTSGTGDINSNSTFPTDNNNCSIVEVLRDLVVNRGVLDVFSNARPSGSEVPNNIERIDFVFTTGIQASPIVAELEEAGHIVMEKSGNNPVKVAAITAIDGAGNPTAFSDTVVTINTSDYGITGNSINNNFLVDPSTTGGVTNPEFTRQLNERIGGVLVTLADFGISAGDIYYGFAMFGTDVDENTVDLLQPQTFPQNTPHGTGATGGADWQGGMGGFWSSPQYSTSMFSDYGDAPATYDSGNSGEHLTTASSGLYLGTVAPDGETSPQSSLDAEGDDDSGDDEDGITSLPTLDTDTSNYSLTVTVNNSGSSAANVYAWLDFDNDGEFDQDERASVADGTVNLDVNGRVAPGSIGTVTLNWNNLGTTGANIITGDSYVRIRLTGDELDSTTETTEQDDASIGIARDGEIEDYQIAIALAAANTISGTVFEDFGSGTTGNDTLEPGENSLGDITLTLYRDDGDGLFDATQDTLETTTISSSSDGTYSLGVNSDGTYFVVLDHLDADAPSLTSALPDRTVREINIAGADITDANFPYDLVGTSFAVCPAEAFLFQTNPSDFYSLILATGNEVREAIDIGNRHINGIGFNPVNSFIYGSNNTDRDSTISRVDSNFNVATLGPIIGLPTTTFFVGDVSPDGKLYFQRGGNLFIIDTDPASSTYLQLDSVQLSTNISITDLAFNPIDEQIYTVANNNSNLYRIDPSTGNVENLGNTGITGSNTFGAQFYDAAGFLYLSRNQDGTIFRVDTRNPASIDATSIVFADGPISNTNDGARCLNAPVSIDYGDAPESYGTSLSNNGARHDISSGTPLYLGNNAPDGELDGQASNAADGDGDDEDGLNLPTLTEGDTSYTIPLADITVSNNIGTAATLHAWIDFDNSGTFEDTEYASATVEDATNDGNPIGDLVWDNINLASADNIYARFRITTDSSINATTPGRAASDGEVEDYQLTIVEAVTSPCPTARADLWFANDESESVDTSEFDDALDFIYQLSDQFVYGEAAGIKAGIFGWTNGRPSAARNNIIIPITDEFSDRDDTGLIGDGSITTDSDGQGVRDQYTGRVLPPGRTELNRATSYLTSLINAGTTNGGRPDTPQVAIILTDANTSQITSTRNGGGSRWIDAATVLKENAGAVIVLILIDDAADAYNNNAIARRDINNVVGESGRVLVVPSYPEAADATNNHVTAAAQAICDVIDPVATDPELLLTKRITAINPGEADQILFESFVDALGEDNNGDADNHPNWPGAQDTGGTVTNDYTVGVNDGGSVLPGDVIEYTIYFLSSGNGDAREVVVCDLIPENTEFLVHDFDTLPGAAGGLSGLDRGLALEYDGARESLTNGSDGDGGYYFAPGVDLDGVASSIDALTDLTCDASGSNPANTNGAVVVNLGTLPPATDPGEPVDSYGLIRFRVRVK